MTHVTLNNLIHQTKDRLNTAGVDNPEIDSRLLIGHALKLDRAGMFSQQARKLTPQEQEKIEKLISRRVAREPVARIMGEREFWGLSFGLNEATLEPRPDSETLIEAALKGVQVSGFGGRQEKCRILDLGTGTGCLLLSLLHELPHAAGLGIDAAARAVEQARINAKNLGLAARAEFRLGNWLSGIDEKFDLIISNPPYIKRGDIEALMPEVRQHDPALALDGGADGMDVYRLLIPELNRSLNKNGLVVFEVGQGQAENVALMLHQCGFTSIATRNDLGGVERCVFGSASHIP